MKFDVTTVLNTIYGKPLQGPDKKDITVRFVLVENLMSFSHDNQEHRTMSGEDKLWRYQLARRINNNDVVELKAEDVSKLKKIVGDGAAPIVVGPLFEFLENEVVPKGPIKRGDKHA